MQLNNNDIHGIIWDLDNTLYRFTDAFYRSCTVAATDAAQELGINLSYDDTLKLAERSEDEHGYSMHGYVTDHGISYASLHFPYHQKVDVNVIDKIMGLNEALQSLDIPQMILTNASRCWAERALDFIGIRDLFPDDKIIPMEDVNFEAKSISTRGFKRAVTTLDSPPEHILMVDDLDRNLMMAKSLGLQTAYMHHGDAMAHIPEYIDAQYRDPAELLKDVTQRC